MPRPTLQTIATKLGISKMTVSRALRGEAHVQADLRERIKAAAETMGYRPDPEIAKLMTHMRQARRREAPRTLAFVWSESTATPVTSSSWGGQLLTGARQRAERLGFQLVEFHLAEKGMSPRRLSSILEARGIPGFVLSPLVSRSRGHVSMHWAKFSSVVIGLGYARPAMHRVHHHHFLGMMTALRRLKKLGYRRIGFVSSSTTNERMFRAWSASFVAHHPLPMKQASELCLLDKDLTRSSFLRWLSAARVDALIDASDRTFGWLKEFKIPEQLGYITLAWQPSRPHIAGIDQQAEVLGAAAVDLLVEQFHSNERGVPEHPKILMTEGIWRDGDTVRKLK
ncbi:MAG: LacI family DNA-binding transcriptional regulator [Verrucomicrobiaceae bacterium]|nr:LacI family DNA-binding transcriptional regulator [Verrucomicrobiaceae bacterium]